MKRYINRRNFIKQSIFSTAALSAPSFDAPSANRKVLQPTGIAPKKVIVIGAGLAGLSAAFELTQTGHDVTVLEARTRSCGRVYTLRDPFSDGIYAEAGAFSFSDAHDLTLKYARLFDLPIVPEESRDLASIVSIKGKRIKAKRGEKIQWPLNLTPEEERLGFAGVWTKYVESVLPEIGKAPAQDLPLASLKKYDQMTFSQFLRRQGLSPDAVAVLRLGYLDFFGDGIDAISALQLLRDTALQTGKKWYMIKGGNDLLPRAFAHRLADKIHHGTPVVKIEHDARGVRVVFLQFDTPQKVTADYVICAIPFSTLSGSRSSRSSRRRSSEQSRNYRIRLLRVSSYKHGGDSGWTKGSQVKPPRTSQSCGLPRPHQTSRALAEYCCPTSPGPRRGE